MHTKRVLPFIHRETKRTKQVIYCSVIISCIGFSAQSSLFFFHLAGCSLIKRKSSICFNLIASGSFDAQDPGNSKNFYIRKRERAKELQCRLIRIFNAFGAWCADKHAESKQRKTNLNKKCMQTGFSIEFSRSSLALSMLHVFPPFTRCSLLKVFTFCRANAKNNKSQVSVSQQQR